MPHVLASKEADKGRQRAPVLEHCRKLPQPRRACRSAPSALSRRNQRQPENRMVPNHRGAASRFQCQADGAVSRGLDTAPELECEVVQVKLNELRLHHPRQWGACWLALTLWEQLELDRFWRDRLPASRQGTKWLEVLLIDPGSEWRLHRHCMHIAPCATCWAVPPMTCLDKLLAHKRAFFSFLRGVVPGALRCFVSVVIDLGRDPARLLPERRVCWRRLSSIIFFSRDSSWSRSCSRSFAWARFS